MVTNKIFVLLCAICYVRNTLAQNVHFTQDGRTRNRRSHLSQVSMSQEPDLHSRSSSRHQHSSSRTPFSSSRREAQFHHHGSRSTFGISDAGNDRRISHSGGRPVERGFRHPGGHDLRPVDHTFSSSRASRLSSRQRSNIQSPEIVIELNRRRSSADSRIMSNSRAHSEFSRRTQPTRFRDDFSRDNRLIGLPQSPAADSFGTSGLSNRGRNIDTSGIFNENRNTFDNAADRFADSRGDPRSRMSDIGVDSHSRVSDEKLTNHGNSLPGLTKLTTDNNAVSLLTELLKGLNSNLNADKPQHTANNPAVHTPAQPPAMNAAPSAAPSQRVHHVQTLPQSPARATLPQSPVGGNTVVIQSHNPASTSHHAPVIHPQPVLTQHSPNIGLGHLYQREMADAPELEEILMRKLLSNIDSPGFSL